MELKWKILIGFIALYVVGMVGVAWHTFDITDPQKGAPTVEMIKIIFIMLGGLGVITPTYLNIWQSVETARMLEDQVRRNIIENTFKLIEKWDDSNLFAARKFTRELKAKQNSLSPNKIRDKIENTPTLKQSVILLYNYFDLIRISIENGRVDKTIVKQSLGYTFNDMTERFKPWIKDQHKVFQQDIDKLSRLLADS